MTYTPSKPTVPGWYWLRWRTFAGCVVRVYVVGKELRCWVNEQAVAPDECPEWEWAGPIPEPGEADELAELLEKLDDFQRFIVEGVSHKANCARRISVNDGSILPPFLLNNTACTCGLDRLRSKTNPATSNQP